VTARNPYAWDKLNLNVFYGRDAELRELAAGLRRGRSFLLLGAARIGKTSLLRKLEESLRRSRTRVVYCHPASWSRVDAPETVFRQLARELVQPGRDPDDVADAGQLESYLFAGVDAGTLAAPVCVLLDEASLLASRPWASDAFAGLRYLLAESRVAPYVSMVVAGGPELRGALHAAGSPLTNVTTLRPLPTLDREAARRLVQEPTGGRVDDVAERLIQERTGRHPFLLQFLMNAAWRGRGPVRHEDVDEASREFLRVHADNFRNWWNRLTPEDRVLYEHTITLRRGCPIRDLVDVVGTDPDPSVQNLVCTGICHREGERLHAAGSLFAEWHSAFVGRSLRDAHEGAEAWERLTRPGQFATVVVKAVGRWWRGIHDGGGEMLRQTREAPFRDDFWRVLSVWQPQAEREPLRRRGPTDLCVADPHDPDTRFHIEFKVWGRRDRNVVGQLLGYLGPLDSVGAVVMLHRRRRVSAPRYRERLLDHLAGMRIVWQGRDDAPGGPLFVTDHERSQGARVRLFHFLLGIPPTREG
jgi:hypothetical protein